MLTLNQICSLPKVQILDLSRNRLTRLPDDIANMKALRVCSVMNNNLEDLPTSLGFLESLRVLKITGNPLNESLRSILDGHDGSPSPLNLPLRENEKEIILLTTRIKLHLKAEKHARGSGGESSSESPLDTPRPLKRNVSLRFPVAPPTSGSESAADLKSPSLHKPAIPARSHYRVASGQNTQIHSATLRRPGVTPLIINNERNRSNSESVLQQSLSLKNKRMGMITRKTTELGTVDETRANRNSYHYRGYSHASVLRDKSTNSARKSGSGSSTPVSPLDAGRQLRPFFRRTPSLLLHKKRAECEDPPFKRSMSIYVSMYHVHSMIGCLLSLMKEGTTKKSSIEKHYVNASISLEVLGKHLNDFSNEEGTSSLRSIRMATCDSIFAYYNICKMLWCSIGYVVGATYEPYTRALLLGVYGGMSEARIAFDGLRTKTRATPTSNPAPSLPSLPPDPPPAYGPTVVTTGKDRPQTVRRAPSETAFRYGNAMKSSSNPYASVALIGNGRSRSNSRTTNPFSSATSSVANTPRSESFTVPPTPNTVSLDTPYLDPVHDLAFEKIFHDAQAAIKKGLSILPGIATKFRHILEVASTTFADEVIIALWHRLTTRARNCLEMCEAVQQSLSSTHLNEPGQQTLDFMKRYCKYAHSYTAMMDVFVEANKIELVDPEIRHLLQPLHSLHQAAVRNIRASPWSWALNSDEPPHLPLKQLPHAINTSYHWNNPNLSHMNMNGRIPYGTYWAGNGVNGVAMNGHHRTRGDSGSSSSPYIASQPATPMSAALGPAAVATVPRTPAVDVFSSEYGSFREMYRR
jgi:hypothetical protein